MCHIVFFKFKFMQLSMMICQFFTFLLDDSIKLLYTISTYKLNSNNIHIMKNWSRQNQVNYVLP